LCISFRAGALATFLISAFGLFFSFFSENYDRESWFLETKKFFDDVSSPSGLTHPIGVLL